MFGVKKKVEKLRESLVTALTDKARYLLREGEKSRALALLDLADVLTSLSTANIEDD